MNTNPAILNIHQVAESAGVTTSLLRVWEARYAWPAPRRLANGYRVFTRHQMEEVCRAAMLVRAGLPISKLIIEGLPRWPAEPERQQLAQPLALARAVHAPASASARQLREQLLSALERAHVGRMRELLQLAPRELRCDEELLGVLAPALIGLAEMDRRGRHLKERDDLLRMISERSLQLLRRSTVCGPAVAVFAQVAASEAAADLVAALLSMRGCAAVRGPAHSAALDEALPVIVGDGTQGPERCGARITVLGRGSGVSIVALTDPAISPMTLLEEAASMAV